MPGEKAPVRIHEWAYDMRVIKSKTPLLPCPFCQCTTVELQEHADPRDDRKTYAVICPGCAAVGPWDKVSTGAERGWNGYGSLD
jgi:hypothetical protein